MKTILMLLVITFAAFASYAQKSKANSFDTGHLAVVAQYSCPMHPEVVSDSAGKCPKCNMNLTLSKKEQMKREVTKTYTCHMHQEVVSDHAGICAKCSSKLVIDRRGSKQGTEVYTCLMHPGVKSNKKGKCPVCGKSLEKKLITADSTQTKS